MQRLQSSHVLRSIVSAQGLFRSQITRIQRFRIVKTLASASHNSAYSSWDFDQVRRCLFTFSKAISRYKYQFWLVSVPPCSRRMHPLLAATYWALPPN